MEVWRTVRCLWGGRFGVVVHGMWQRNKFANLKNPIICQQHPEQKECQGTKFYLHNWNVLENAWYSYFLFATYYESEFTRNHSYKSGSCQIFEHSNWVLNKIWPHLWSNQYCLMQSDGLCSLLTTLGGGIFWGISVSFTHIACFGTPKGSRRISQLGMRHQFSSVMLRLLGTLGMIFLAGKDLYY